MEAHHEQVALRQRRGHEFDSIGVGATSEPDEKRVRDRDPDRDE
jgi:hypothetical protein